MLARDTKIYKDTFELAKYVFGVMRQYDTYHIRRKLIGIISPEIWSKIYVKGHYESIHLLRNTKRTGCVDDYPKVYYMKDPINFELAGIEIPVETQPFISDNP